ncbi:MAG: hypothetical protein ABMA13_22890 [Chthoniobacteraceae bacterium]
MSERKCPMCHGVPVEPREPRCRGCSHCDFSGTLAGYEQMQRCFAEAMAEADKIDPDREDCE